MATPVCLAGIVPAQRTERVEEVTHDQDEELVMFVKEERNGESV